MWICIHGNLWSFICIRYNICIAWFLDIRISTCFQLGEYHLNGSMNTFWLTQIIDIYEHKHRTWGYSRVRSSYSYLMACGSQSQTAACTYQHKQMLLIFHFASMHCVPITQWYDTYIMSLHLCKFQNNVCMYTKCLYILQNASKKMFHVITVCTVPWAPQGCLH